MLSKEIVTNLLGRLVTNYQGIIGQIVAIWFYEGHLWAAVENSDGMIWEAHVSALRLKKDKENDT